MNSENNSIDRKIENGITTFGTNFSVVYAASRGLASPHKTISSVSGGELPAWEDYVDNKAEGISRFAGGAYAGAKARLLAEQRVLF